MPFDRTRATRSACALAACALAACASPNLYATARALRPGQLQHTVALEGVASARPEAAILPSLPTYQLRVGVARGADVGLRIANGTSVGVDTRVELARGSIDVAVIPGLQGTYLPFSSGPPAIVYGHVPVVLVVHPSRAVDLTWSAGVSWAATFGRAVIHTDTVHAPIARDATDAGAALRIGVGLAARVHPRLRLLPEVTALVAPETGRTTLTAGFGFQWGAIDEAR